LQSFSDFGIIIAIKGEIMKVRELRKLLEGFDQEAEIVTADDTRDYIGTVNLEPGFGLEEVPAVEREDGTIREVDAYDLEQYEEDGERYEEGSILHENMLVLR